MKEVREFRCVISKYIRDGRMIEEGLKEERGERREERGEGGEEREEERKKEEEKNKHNNINIQLYHTIFLIFRLISCSPATLSSFPFSIFLTNIHPPASPRPIQLPL